MEKINIHAVPFKSRLASCVYDSSGKLLVKTGTVVTDELKITIEGIGISNAEVGPAATRRPRSSELDRCSPKATEATSIPRVCRKTVLVADDSPIRTILRFFLEQAGYRVLEAGDGKQVIQTQRHPLQINFLFLCALVVFLFGCASHRETNMLHPADTLHAGVQASFDGEIPPGEVVVLRYDSTNGSVGLHRVPSLAVTDVATRAVALVPRWLRAVLRAKLALLTSDLQNSLAQLLLDCRNPRCLDEIAFSIAQLPIEDLQRKEFRPCILTENANLLYAADECFEFVRLIDVGTPGIDDDFYTTARYRLQGSEGTEEFYELPKEVYYWYIVHPKLMREPVIYIDPTTGKFAEPENGGVFWRRYYLFEDPDVKRRASTHFVMEYPNLITQKDLAACAPFAQGCLVNMEIDPIPLIVDSQTQNAVLCIFAWPGGQFDGNIIATTIPVEAAYENGNTRLLENLLRTGNASAMFDPKILPEGFKEIRFAILKDRDPFGKPTIENALASMGFSYDVFKSNEIDKMLESKVNYLKIIVPSGQPHRLYQALAEKRETFRKWMTRETHACWSVIEFHGAIDPSFPEDDWSGMRMPWGFTCLPQTDYKQTDLSVSGYPVMQAVLHDEKYLWNTKPVSLSSEGALPLSAHAIEKLGHFVTQNQLDRCAEVPPYYRGPDNNAQVEGNPGEFVQKLRSHFPQRSLYLHYGNCGEVMDMLSAACRTALVPVRNVIANCVDHVWNDTYVLGKWNVYTVFRSDGGTRFAADTYQSNHFAAMGCRSDGYVTNTISTYYKELINLTVTVKDASGRPVDGATIAVKSHWNKGEPPPKIHATAAWTDLNGIASVELGKDRNFFIQVYSPLACWPEGTLPIEEHRKIKGRPTDDEETKKLPEPQIVILASDAKEAGANFVHEVVLNARIPAPEFSEQEIALTPKPALQLSLSLYVNNMILHGYCAYTQTSFAESLDEGSLDVFLVNKENLEKLLRHEPFVAAKVVRDVSSAQLPLVLPDQCCDWFVVISNLHKISCGQVLQATMRLGK